MKWGLLVERASRYATEGNLGLSRNMYLSMADFLTRRWKLAEALQQYLFVCALDTATLEIIEQQGAVIRERLV